VSVAQTVAEKFVALTRRVAVEQGTGATPDPTLVRHIYDLWAVREHYELDQAAALIPALIRSDAEAFGNQFPAYRDDPIGATRAALAALRQDLGYGRRFSDFQLYMVYGDRVDFKVALQTLVSLFELIQEMGV
jgi:hypothetical protein